MNTDRYLGICGATLASAVVRTLFGFDPPIDGSDFALRRPDVPRGFDGVLRNVRYRGKLYDITSRADVGLTATEVL